MKKVWENEVEFDEHPEITPLFDPDCEESYKLIPEKHDGNFVHPDAIRRGEIYAEDIEEAIIQYLVKYGDFDEDDLRVGRMEFRHPDDTSRSVTTKDLLIKF